MRKKYKNMSEGENETIKSTVTIFTLLGEKSRKICEGVTKVKK